MLLHPLFFSDALSLTEGHHRTAAHTLTHLVSADLHAGRLAGGPSVQVLPRWCFVADAERQDEAAWVRPAQAVVHLSSTSAEKECRTPAFCTFLQAELREQAGQKARWFAESLCGRFFHLGQSLPRLAQVLDEIIVDGLAVVCAAQVQHQEAVLLEGVDLVEGGDGFGVVLHRADLRGENTVDKSSFHAEPVKHRFSRKVTSDDWSQNVSSHIFPTAVTQCF